MQKQELKKPFRWAGLTERTLLLTAVLRSLVEEGFDRIITLREKSSMSRNIGRSIRGSRSRCRIRSRDRSRRNGRSTCRSRSKVR